MKIIVHEDRTLEILNQATTKNENEVEQLEFEFPDKYKNWNKKIVFSFIDAQDIYWDLIQDNIYTLEKNVTMHGQVDFYVWLTHETKDFRTETKPLYFNDNIDASGEITPEEIGAVNKILEEVDEALQEVENIDIDVTKEGDTATITVTKKDGSQESVEVQDGKDGKDGQDGQPGADGKDGKDGADGKDGIDGKDAKINGYNTISIEEGTNIDIEQEGNILTINTKGLQQEITSQNKLDSDLVDDTNQTNKFVTSVDKTNWNNKVDKNVNNLTYYTLKTDTGSLIDLEINSSTYVVTLMLKDIDGNVISTDTIDLPLESVVVNGSFDSVNKKIILTLQNGNTVEIPVGDLVAGLQTEITSQNKLASDLVDDSNSGNKFVTTSEKQTWNNKLDQEDLADYVKNTDYATSSKGGTIKADNDYGFGVNASGKLYAPEKTYAQYQNAGVSVNIGKGTLENVITGKNLETANNKVTEIDENSTDTQYPSAKAVYDSQEEQNEKITDLQNLRIINTPEKATEHYLTDSADSEVVDMTIEGNTVQDDEPTSENPQEIKNVESVEVKIQNKNLFDKENAINGKEIAGGSIVDKSDWCISDYIPIKLNINYHKNIITGNSAIIYDKNKVWLAEVRFDNNQNIYITNENAKYLVINMPIMHRETYQLEQGTVATSYEPHKEQTILFPLASGQKLMLGDRLEDDGIHQLWNEDTVNGTTATFNDAKTNGAYYCDQKVAGNLTEQTITFDTAVTNATVQYELAEEIIIPYTQEQQIAYNNIKKARTYKNITHITSEEEVKPYIDLTYVVDEETYIENKTKDFVKFDDYPSFTKGGAVKSASYGFYVTNEGYPYAENISYANYQNRNIGTFIGKQTLENVITGKGLVKDTDYASNSKAGAVKLITDRGLLIQDNGGLYPEDISYSEYGWHNRSTFISKGTLENVITGKKLLAESDIKNNVVSTDTNKPLSANMGKELNDRIQNLASIGKYLAMWDCTTGLPTTDPVTMPYTYTTGDYYVISNVGATNYMPNGSSYSGTASSTQYSGTETLNVGDFFYYDGTVWTMLKNTGKTVYFANIAGNPTDNSNLANALNGKVGFTDYASNSQGGTFKTNANAGTYIDNGVLYPYIRPYNNYLNDNNVLFMSKGTFENVMSNRFITLTQAEYDALETKDANAFYFIEEE